MSKVTVCLGALDSSDMALVRSWRNDHRIWGWCRQNDLISDAEQVRWFNKQSEDPAIKMYKIVVAKDKALTPVGVCGLTSIDYVNRRAEFSLYVAPEAQGNGLGRAGLALLLGHGFDNLGLNVIWGESFAHNPAIKMFRSLGLCHEGLRRQFYFRDGKFIDAELFSITAEEWHARSPGDDKHVSEPDNPGLSSKEESERTDKSDDAQDVFEEARS